MPQRLPPNIRGPTIIGQNSVMDTGTYVDPYTSIGNRVTTRNSEVENSIIMDAATIDCGKRIVDSIIGQGAKVLNSDRNVPRGHRLILGDTTYVTI